jgi:ubiquinone/menaquinone biosynthesis C-methylase UbiE
VADIGCGPATMVKELLDRGFNVTGTDIAPHMIEECKVRFGNDPHATFLVSTADRIPLSDASQDAVTAMGLLEYINDEPAALREFHRILKPGGLAVLTYPHYWSPSRAWNRFTHLLALPILLLLGKRRNASGVKHREYHLASTLKMIRDTGFMADDVVFYNFKLGLRPLDSWFPKTFMHIAEALERFCRTPVLRRIGTGFIVLAKKT